MPVERKYNQTINMPQMALTGLSESWLFKEIGDCHWHMLCKDLGLKSNEILDEFGNRLYASFIRIKFESQSSLKDFRENEILDITGKIQRLGNSLYYGQISLKSLDKEIQCSLATSFTLREDATSNTKLTKGVPSGSDANAITNISEIPNHVLDYTKLKKGTIRQVPVGDHTFTLTDDLIFNTTYRMNPYTDINGVGLLYFAAYPMINDYCELDYFNNNRISGDHWALDSSTMMRDVFYLANCNIDDTISYRLHSYDIIARNRMAIYSTLWRDKDATMIARIFAIKQFLPSNK